ncbi:MAG: EF-P lysine aminoacylase EpmA [bacterium]|nr:EF-P lysine aminoacylase EpmA [bacterium]
MPSRALKARADLLTRLRHFFAQRGLTEVSTPLLCSYPNLEAHIDPVPAGSNRWLPSSPEYAMKRLLAAGSGSIYQICPAFRLGELGAKHQPEFTLLEFYLVAQDHWGLMDFVDQLLQEVLGWPAAQRIDYAEVFRDTLGINALALEMDAFAKALKSRQMAVPEFLMTANTTQTDRLDYLFSTLIEPDLGTDRPVLLTGYPPFMAALARIDQGRAARFEVFYRGLELGNGFWELKDPAEQRARFEEANRQRVAAGKSAYGVDERFLACLDQLPDCAGIALGLDRLLMLWLGVDSIDQVLTLPWDQI